MAWSAIWSWLVKLVTGRDPGEPAWPYDRVPPPRSAAWIWHLTADGSEDGRRLFLSFPDGRRVPVCGWLAPPSQDGEAATGITLYIDNRAQGRLSDETLPGNAFDVLGMVYCDSAGATSDWEIRSAVESQLKEHIRLILDGWLQRSIDASVYRDVIEASIERSPRLCHLLLTHPIYSQLAEQFHQIPTRDGPISLQTLLSEVRQSTAAYPAVQAVHPKQPRFSGQIGGRSILDLRASFDRTFTLHHVTALNGTIEFVDVARFDPGPSDEPRPPLTEDERRLVQKIRTGLKSSPRHRQVRVQLVTQSVLRGVPAALLPLASVSTAPTSDGFVTARAYSGQAWTTMLQIDPASDLARYLLGLPDRDEILGHAALAVHKMAALLMTQGHPIEWHTDHWSETEALIHHILTTNARLDELERWCAQRGADLADTANLLHLVEKQREQLRQLEILTGEGYD